MRRVGKKVTAVCLALVMAVTLIPAIGTMTAYAANGDLIEGEDYILELTEDQPFSELYFVNASGNEDYRVTVECLEASDKDLYVLCDAYRNGVSGGFFATVEQSKPFYKTNTDWLTHREMPDEPGQIVKDANFVFSLYDHQSNDYTNIAGAYMKIRVRVEPIYSINGATITLAKSKVTYNGKAQKPAVTSVKLNGKTLRAGTDYVVDYYEDNVNVGKGYVAISGIGDYFERGYVNFTIVKAANPLKLKAKTATVKYSKVKKKAQTVAVSKVVCYPSRGQ